MSEIVVVYLEDGIEKRVSIPATLYYTITGTAWQAGFNAGWEMLEGIIDPPEIPDWRSRFSLGEG